MSIKKHKVVLSFVLILWVYVGVAIASDKNILKFQNHFNQTQTFVTDFQQVYFDALLETESISSGKLFYKKPGLMRWVYEEPDLMEIVIGKEKIWIYEPDLENVTIQNIEQVSRMDALAFLLKNEHLETHFYASHPDKFLLDESDQNIALYLRPKKENSNISELQIALDKNTFRIVEFVLVDNQMNFRKIKFSSMVLNVKIPNTKFEFEVTEGMEVIDEMDN